jgi:thioredoxin 1
MPWPIMYWKEGYRGSHSDSAMHLTGCMAESVLNKLYWCKQIEVKEQKMADEVGLVHVNDKTFASEVLSSNVPVLVDFWATWCGPCRSISPIVEELAKEFSGRVKVTKLNVDESPATPTQYGVRGIPTLILFKGGKIFDQIVGAVPKARLKALIEKAL